MSKMLELADEIAYGLATEGKHTLFREGGEVVVAALRLSAGSATSPIGQADVQMLKHLADSMGFGRTHDMLRRVIAACPYLTSPARNVPQSACTEAAVELVEALNDIEISAYNAARFRIGKALALLTGESQCQAACANEDCRVIADENADNVRLLDYVADKIGLPKDQELSQVNFAAWLAGCSQAVSEVDPADLWDRYCKETPKSGRTPQGAMAFAVDALSRPQCEGK